MTETIDLTLYLLTRLHQLGIRAVHGVPGDFNLAALDYLETASLYWVGNSNELSAGYAADGYARIKGIGALITTGGVGELSALNAIAGAYAERAPVVNIVGTPPTTAQDKLSCLHHSLGDGRIRVFSEIAAKVTVAQANLRDPSTAATLIDQTLQTCIMQSRPVYIELPMDMVDMKVLASSLAIRINVETPWNDERQEDILADKILGKIYSAEQPFIIVDGFTNAYSLADEADELVRRTGFPTATTPFGKSTICETYPNFHGVYTGAVGKLMYKPWVDSCDLIIQIAPLASDSNTFGFTTVPDPTVTITFHRDSVNVCGTESFGDQATFCTKRLLRKVLNRLDKSKLFDNGHYPHLGSPMAQMKALLTTNPNEPLDQSTFWQRISIFFRPGDIILTESGTSSVGGREFVLPPNTKLINSALWMSIGYMLAASAGASIAQREMTAAGTSSAGRTILFVGDGSLQIGAQAISDMIRNRLDIIIFIINNDGYTIERWVHGMTASYNDIQQWRYLEAPNYFGAPKNDLQYPVTTKRVANWSHFNEALGDIRVNSGKGLCLIEVIMGKCDAPDMLKKILKKP
jgi:pyruvate decarboxylase